MTNDPEHSGRTRVVAWESVSSAAMLIGGLLLSRLGGLEFVGLAVMLLGVGGLVHAALYGLGLASLPTADDEGVNHVKDDDAAK